MRRIHLYHMFLGLLIVLAVLTVTPTMAQDVTLTPTVTPETTSAQQVTVKPPYTKRPLNVDLTGTVDSRKGTPRPLPSGEKLTPPAGQKVNDKLGSVRSLLGQFGVKQADLEKAITNGTATSTTDYKLKMNKFNVLMSKITDIKKKETVSKLNTDLTEVNTRLVKQMSNDLKKMSLILEKLTTKSTTLAANGKDVTTLNTLIVTATTNITDAQTAVTAQSTKTYVVSSTTTDALKTGATSTFQQMRSDLKVANDAISKAKTAIYAAITQLAVLEGITLKPILSKPTTTVTPVATRVPTITPEPTVTPEITSAAMPTEAVTPVPTASQ
ncbi:hypothetical protein HGB07_03645 [Candidatus Roizmanbacteria bacterium]|nr:hypothetical protein [Candidatus Roizmanbacteria bacterium]